MVLVKVEGLVKKGEDSGTAEASFTTEDLSPDTELAEIFRKLDLEGEFVVVRPFASMVAGF